MSPACIEPVLRQPARRALEPFRRVACWLLAMVAVALYGWFLDAHFVSVLDGSSLEWLVIAPAPGWRLAIIVTVVAAVLFALDVAGRRGDRHADGLPRSSRARRPGIPAALLLLFACLILPIAMRRPESELAPILAYVLVDLRWWFAGAVLGLVLLSAGPIIRMSAHGWTRTLPLGRRCRPEYVAALGAVAVALAVSPVNRFEVRRLAGDEPKYLRQAENLLQGNGFDMRDLQDFDALPATDRTRLLQSVAMLPATLGRELPAMVADVPATFAGGGLLDAGARPLPNWFIEGKSGGVYEVHNPGLGLLLMPSYVLDRTFAPVRVRQHLDGSLRHFPSRLIGASLMMLALFAAWTAAAVHFFVRTTGRPAVALLLAVVAFGTLPVQPFNLQFYPEVPAGLITIAVAGYLLFDRGDGRGRAMLAGAATGFLPWLYPRYIPLAVVLIGWMAFADRREGNHRPRAVWFFAGCAAMLAPLALYYYNITGSVLPTSTFESRGIDPFHPGRVMGGLAGFAFDRHYGVLPNAPVYLLALPGLWWAIRAQPRVFALAGLLTLSLAVLSAGHATWFGGGSGPGRLIVAVMPMVAMPVAWTIGRYGHSLVFWMLAGVLLVVSLDNVISYHREARLVLADASFSGWKPNLLFPVLVGANPARAAEAPRLLWTWVAIMGALAVLPVVRPAGLLRVVAGIRVASLPPALMTALALFVSGSALIGLLQADPFDRRYVEQPGRARSRAETVMLERGCLLCLSSRDDPGATLPAEAGRPGDAEAGDPAPEPR